jgi:NADPH-dependent curcumin reductase CurA
MVNRRFLLASRPVGVPRESDFRMEEAPLPVPQGGEVLLRALYLSVDPYMRGRMSAATSYAPSVEIGGLMVGGAVGEVLESKHPDFKVGDIVTASTGWQEYAVARGPGLHNDLRKVDPSGFAPISTALGVLGMPGLTAYFGMRDVCAVKPGETVVVSGAAGAVGSAAGQIAKIAGSRVVGVAGGPAKVGYVTGECGFDAALDYKATRDYAEGLRKLCPKGIDAYFDNVGGPISDAVFTQLNLHARIAICGQISLSNSTEPPQGPRLLRHLLVARAKVQGFLILDYTPEQSALGLAALSEWVRAGKIKYREDVVEGFENMPRALIGLFLGENIGKRVVKVG